ncbi:MAG: ABC transporter permease, partial [Candidatus Methanomethylophilaceae archaeon]
MIAKVSLKDLKGRPARTVGMVGVVAVLAFALLAGSLLNVSLNNGADAVELRLGADIMVVPLGYGDEEESVLISGEPSTFYMDRGIVDIVASTKGVEKYSPQLFLTSIPDADCCDFMVQIIGFDPETDFTITPWIAETYADEGIIVGSEIYPSIYPDGLKVTFFGHQFDVAAKLSPSGTGADTTVYMDMDTLREAIKYAEPTSEAGKVDPDTQVSTVLVKAADDYDLDLLVWNLKTNPVDIVRSSEVISDITGRMGSLIGFIDLFQVTIVFMAAVVLIALFSLYVFENRKEYAVLRMIGASRSSVSGLVLSEAAI